MDKKMLESQDWTFPIPIAFGPGRLEEIGKFCVELEAKKPLIVTDSGSANLPFLSELKEKLSNSGLTFDVYSKISPNPLDTEIGSGCEKYREGTHDCVIAIGGGSAMDGGKAICLTANNEFDLWDFEYEKKPPEIDTKLYPFPKLITIPTTAGTGAETESTAMITHTNKGMKFCIFHPKLKPDLAILDPVLTLNLPLNLTAWTGADALTHAIEAFLVPGFHPTCDAMALEALSLISKWLPVVYEDPQNLNARSGMLVGSCLAGVSFLKGLGLVHAISHMIGAEYNTQHGLTNAIILPTVLRFNLPGMEEKVSRMAQSMNLTDNSISGFIGNTETLLNRLEIPKSLSEIGIPINCSKRIAEKALIDSAAATNPRKASALELENLIKQSIAGFSD